MEDAGPPLQVRLRAGVDRAGWCLSHGELEAWAVRFADESLPIVQARLREILAPDGHGGDEAVKAPGRAFGRRNGWCCFQGFLLPFTWRKPGLFVKVRPIAYTGEKWDACEKANRKKDAC